MKVKIFKSKINVSRSCDFSLGEFRVAEVS